MLIEKKCRKKCFLMILLITQILLPSCRYVNLFYLSNPLCFFGGRSFHLTVFGSPFIHIFINLESCIPCSFYFLLLLLQLQLCIILLFCCLPWSMIDLIGYSWFLSCFVLSFYIYIYSSTHLLISRHCFSYVGLYPTFCDVAVTVILPLVSN